MLVPTSFFPLDISSNFKGSLDSILLKVTTSFDFEEHNKMITYLLKEMEINQNVREFIHGRASFTQKDGVVIP